MGVKAVVGATWGDEGKGRIVDYLCGSCDAVVRFQGGKNAGHTVINDLGRFVLHMLPSGVFHQSVLNIISQGSAVDGNVFFDEMDELIKKGIHPKVIISERAQMVMPYHTLLDRYEEERLKDRQFGSTQSGIAPFYSQKYLKIGIQIADIFDKYRLKNKVRQNLEITNTLFKHLYQKPTLCVNEVTDSIHELGIRLKPYVTDTHTILQNMMESGKEILLEGQLGTLRDPDNGIYPFSTSSSPLAGFASVGAGIAPHAINMITGVIKAYATCVGEGPFVTEIKGEMEDKLRKMGGDSGEFGATTGRPRRVGYLDLVAANYGLKVQGATECALTCLDVLNMMDEIKICTAYEINGIQTTQFPPNAALEKAKPVYTTLKGWNQDVRGITDPSDLCDEVKAFILFIKTRLSLPITYISTGPKRDSIISLY